MRVDDCRHRIGLVMEAVDEIKTQSDQPRHGKKDVRRPGDGKAVGLADVAHQAVTGKHQAAGKHAEEKDGGDRTRLVIENETGSSGARHGSGVGVHGGVQEWNIPMILMAECDRHVTGPEIQQRPKGTTPAPSTLTPRSA